MRTDHAPLELTPAAIAAWITSARAPLPRLLGAEEVPNHRCTAIVLDRHVDPAMVSLGDPVATLTPLTACTSVLTQALATSGWNPHLQAGRSSIDGFASYLSAIGRQDFFDGEPSRFQDSVALREGESPLYVATEVARLMPALDAGERDRVARSIVHMAHLVMRGDSNHASATANLMIQHVIEVRDTAIHAIIHWCQVAMSYDRETQKNCISVRMQNTFSVQRLTFCFSLARWTPDLRRRVEAKGITSVDTWLTNLTSH